MAIGKCVNISKPCSKAINREEIEADKVNFVCPECGKPLVEIQKSHKKKSNQTDPKDPKGPNWKLIGIISAVVLAVAGVGYGAYTLFGKDSDMLGKVDKIMLDKEEVTLLVDGKPKTIKAFVVDKDGKEVKDAKVVYQWAVDNSDIATVTQQGKVMPVKEGNATITVTIEGNKKLPGTTCKVNVKEAPGSKMIEEISIIGARNLTLRKGSTIQLRYQTKPVDNSEAPEWESSNIAVASINGSGVVNGVATGKAQIRVKSSKVISAPVTVTVIELIDPVLNLSYGTYTGQIKNGYPNGQGRLVYSRSRQISRYDNKNRMAKPGDVVQGTFKNGFFTVGKHFDSAGNMIEMMNIGVAEDVFEQK